MRDAVGAIEPGRVSCVDGGMEPDSLTVQRRWRRTLRRVAAWGVVVIGCALSGAARAADSPSQEIAERAVEALRDDAHRESTRIEWPDVADEIPVPGSEVLFVTSFRSTFRLMRITFRSESATVESVQVGPGRTASESAGSVEAWTASVDGAAFACVWNAAQRVRSATEESVAVLAIDADLRPRRIVCGPRPWRWARMSAGPVVVATLSALERPYGSGRCDWEYIRDQAVLSILSDFAETTVTSRTSADAAGWTAFARDHVAAAATRLGDPDVAGDAILLNACLRLVAESGSASVEGPVAALKRALMGLDAETRARLSATANGTARAELQLRVRHHFSREDMRKFIRELQSGNRFDDEDYRWLRSAFRARDPGGFAELVTAELTDCGVEPAAVAPLMDQIASLPREHALGALRELVARPSPEVRLEAAIALRGADPQSVTAQGIVVALALDRTIAFPRREDKDGRSVRSRALAAAMDWGGLTPAQLRDHLMSGQSDDPAFLRRATGHLRGTPSALTANERRDVWRRLLDAPTMRHVLGAVEFLVDDGDVESRERMLAAIDRLSAVGGAADADTVPLAQWREFAAGVRERGDRNR